MFSIAWVVPSWYVLVVSDSEFRGLVDVDPSTLQLPPVDLGSALDLVIASCVEIPDAPLGHRDHREAQQLEMLQGVSEWSETAFDAEEWLRTYRRGRDYQEDHPLSSVDRILDRAFVPEGLYGADDMLMAAGTLDDLALRRLGCYSTRCASRALSTGGANLAVAGLRAFAWTLGYESSGDSRDEMVGLAPLHVAASATGLRHPLRILYELATGFSESANTILAFSRRTDITLSAFGWERVQTGHGSWIVSML